MTNLGNCACYEGSQGAIWTNEANWYHSANAKCSDMSLSTTNIIASYSGCNPSVETLSGNCISGMFSEAAPDINFEMEDNILLSGNRKGMVLKDELGKCWLINVDSAGALKTISVPCPS